MNITGTGHASVPSGMYSAPECLLSGNLLVQALCLLRQPCYLAPQLLRRGTLHCKNVPRSGECAENVVLTTNSTTSEWLTLTEITPPSDSGV